MPLGGGHLIPPLGVRPGAMATRKSSSLAYRLTATAWDSAGAAAGGGVRERKVSED